MTHPHPSHPVARWGTFLAALLVVGPAIGMIAHRIPPIPGAGAGTALQSSSPGVSLAFVGVCVALATGIGVLGARVVSASHGLTCAGIALAWAVFRTSRILDLSRAVDVDSLGMRLTIEGGVVGVLVLIGALVIVRLAPKHGHTPLAGIVSGAGIGSGVVTTVIGLLVAMIIAQDDKAGQTFAAAIAGGAVGAAAARTLVNGAPWVAALLAIPLGALACPAVGFAMSPKPLDVAIVGGTVHALARIMPLDWCAGALIGIPFGLTWAGSMIQKSYPDPKAGARVPPPVTSAS